MARKARLISENGRRICGKCREEKMADEMVVCHTFCKSCMREKSSEANKSRKYAETKRRCNATWYEKNKERLKAEREARKLALADS